MWCFGEEVKAMTLGTCTKDLRLRTPPPSHLEALPQVWTSQPPSGEGAGWDSSRRFPHGPLFPPQEPRFSLLGQEPGGPLKGRLPCRDGGDTGLRTLCPDWRLCLWKRETQSPAMVLRSLSDSRAGGENFYSLRVILLCY